MGQPHSFLDTSLHLTLGQIVSLSQFSEDVQNHMKVRRIRAKEMIHVLNGRGFLFKAQAQVNGKDLKFEVCDVIQKPHPLPKIELALSPPLGDALLQTITQATEIGVASVRLIKSDHSQYKKGKWPLPQRLQRVSDAACEQCERLWRLQIQSSIDSIEELFEDSKYITIFADEEMVLSENPLGILPSVDFKSEKNLRLFVGPEGGWSARERELFISNKCHRLGLGELILRVPTAVVAACQLLRIAHSPNNV